MPLPIAISHHACICVCVCLTMVFPRGSNGNVCIAEEKYVKKFSNLNIFPLSLTLAHPIPSCHDCRHISQIAGNCRYKTFAEGSRRTL